MYLADQELRARLTELDVHCDNPSHPFSADDQIQPCSIDLRLSNVFWEPLKARTVDLRSSHLLEIAPRRYWKRRTLTANESIVLKPGHLLLGRIYEKFSVPRDLAGKIEGRSSFSRLGIGVHVTGDFLNPAYRGHMPLQLFNFSRSPIRIYPYLPICQLMLVQLSSEPSTQYGATGLQSKYMDDDGGPSYWWRDKRIRSLQESFRKGSIALSVQETLLQTLGVQEPEILEDFERFIGRSRKAIQESGDTLLELFAKSQDNRRLRNKVGRNLALGTFFALLGVSLGSLFARPYGVWHYILWGATLISFVPFVWSQRDVERKYFGARELEESRQAAVNQRS